ncbi:MFS transporter [Bradyrhizobium sp. WSM3983]|uniref:MFS transporter n=1 Tax=Bradyrhizobium sp. WSM3983 TaxID=1038867 RepID=UPI000684B3AC|nr:MFS transporter [Bradyrhizobium sp. WSM3983]
MTQPFEIHTTSRARLPIKVALTMLGMLGITYAINAMDRIVFPVLLPNINKSFAFSLEQGGFLSTIFTLGIGLSGLPTGFLMDRLTRLKVLVIGVALYSVLTIMSAFSIGFYDMAFYRTLSGVGEGMQQAALFTAVGAYFANNRAVALGSMNFAYGVGSFVGPMLAAYLLFWSGDWRVPLISYGLLGLVIIIATVAAVSPSFTEQAGELVDMVVQDSTENLPPNVLNWNVVICAISAVTLGVAGYGFLGLYPTFLRSELGFSVTEAGLAASLFGAGALFGIPAGYVADRFNQRWIAIFATIVMMVNNYSIFNLARSAAAQGMLALLAGAIGSGFVFINTYALIQRCVRPAQVGRASGVMITCLYLPASLAGYLFALLVNHSGWGNAALLQLCLVPLVAIVAMLFLDTSAVRGTKRTAVVKEIIHEQ